MGCLCGKDDAKPETKEAETEEKDSKPKEEVGKSTVTELEVEKTYRFGETLGSGASCRVVKGYLKKDESNKVAIKIMDKENKALQKLYKREVNILRTLCSEGKQAGILDFVGYQETNSCYYVVTKLLSGGELFDRIVSKEDKYKITEKVAVNLIRSMFESLKICHDKNIIHRDLKPENFVFADKSVDSEVVLIDYGCARVVKDDDTIDDVVGTAYYLAPELAVAALENYARRGKKIHPDVAKSKPRNGKILRASDVWSMGVIAYVMMTGRAPFRGKDNQAIFESICLKPLVFPEKDARYHNKLNLNVHFKDFCTKVLVKDPEKRLTIEECLRHPWVRGVDAKDFELNKDVIHYLKQFTYQCKLKKEIIRVLAANMTEQPEEQVRRHFNRLDVDGDGELDLDELTILLLDMGYAKTVARGEAAKMMKSADLNNDGALQFDEFKAVWYRKVLTTNEQYIHRVFNVFDDNGDGYIDSSELMHVLFPESLNKDGSNENEDEEKEDEESPLLKNVVNMIAEVDENGDGKIEFEEFKKAMKEDVEGDTWNVDEMNCGGFIGKKVDGMVDAEDMKQHQKEFKPPVEDESKEP